MYRLLGRLAAGSVLLAAICSLPAEASFDPDSRATRIEEQAAQLEIRLQNLQSEVTERQGFIGAQDAQNRYESGVYAYLIGDYSQSARIFFSLVESRSLKYRGLQTDSEWYLAESLFEMKNYALADEAYQLIVDGGRDHPFFDDAIRRQMEIYGITSNGTRFYELYNSYIVSNQIEPTDIIRYTLAKSFYRQGNYARAKSMLLEIPSESLFFGKARYVLGTVMVVEGNYDLAIAEFEAASGITPLTLESQEIVDLANLALGRLHYEQGNFLNSAQSYQKIGRQSRYFPDALYEIGWTFIKNGEYEQALRSVEIFLLAYDDHRYAPQLRILQGHLHMKVDEYEEALVAYEEVVLSYMPVQAALDDMASGSSQAWLRHFVTLSEMPDENSFRAPSASTEGSSAFNMTEKLPAYAVEMLVSDPSINRALVVYKDLSKQQQDLEESEALIEELETALDKGVQELASFEILRDEIFQIQSDCYLAFIELLRTESTITQIQGTAEGRARLRTANDQLKNAEELLNEGISKRDFGTLGSELEALHGTYISLHRKSGLHANALQRLDAAWARVLSVEGELSNARQGLDAQESSELMTVRSRLADETAEVARLRRQLRNQLSEAESLSAEITRSGFQDLSDQFAQHMLEADTGIVDVYWTRKIEVSDDLEDTKRKKNEDESDLNDRFTRLRAGLEAQR